MTRTLPVAQHEAGHAVVGVYLGLTLRRVRLTPDQSHYAGYDGYADFRGRLTRRRLQFGVMYAAGAAADSIRGLNDPWGWAFDFDLIADCGFSPSERRILIDVATRYLRGPCRRAWEDVTEELLHRDLTGPEIKALVLHGDREALEP